MPAPGEAPPEFAIFSSIGKEAADPISGNRYFCGAPDAGAPTPEPCLAGKVNRVRRALLAMYLAAARATDREAIRAREYRNRLSCAARSSREVCSSSIALERFSAATLASCAQAAGWRQTPRCGDPKMADGLSANAPCSCGRLCSKCRQEESIFGPTTDRETPRSWAPRILATPQALYPANLARETPRENAPQLRKRFRSNTRAPAPAAGGCLPESASPCTRG